MVAFFRIVLVREDDLKFGLFIIGDSDPAVADVKDYYERTNYVLFAMNFATLEQQRILDSMERMASEVMPGFRNDA